MPGYVKRGPGRVACRGAAGEGLTWEANREAAGMSRQAAHNRWAAQVRKTLDRYGAGKLGGPVPDDEADLDPGRPPRG